MSKLLQRLSDASRSGVYRTSRTDEILDATRGSALHVARIDLAGAAAKEALETLALIRKGGPFPHQRDGVVFSNREKLLPARERGWYREYTVRTPGERTRGARRIVAGRDGTLYYTDDHYRSFRRVLE